MLREDKIRALAALARHRRLPTAGSTLEGYSRYYKRLEHFHDGFYDQHDWVGPWSISACNVDSDIMLVAQDWASEDYLLKPPDHRQRELGHNPDLPTNKNLKRLLRDAFIRDFPQVYATNAFVFIKPAGMGNSIPISDLTLSVQTYTLREIEIVRPKIAICIGGGTFNGLRLALGLPYQALKHSRYDIAEATAYDVPIYGVPHVGGVGLAVTGGYARSLEIWQRLAARLRAL